MLIADYLIPIIISGQLIRSSDGQGQLYVASRASAFIHDRIWLVGADHCIRIFSMDGILVKWFGGWGDANELFNIPMDIVASGDQVFISDSCNRCVKVFNQTGDFQSKLPIPDTFGRPSALAICTERKELFVSDRTLIGGFQIHLDGRFLRLVFSSTKFEHIGAIIIADDQMMILDTARLTVYIFDINTGSLLRHFDAVCGIQPRKMALYKHHLYIAMHDKINIFDMDGLYVQSFPVEFPTALCFVGDELMIADSVCKKVQLQKVQLQFFR